MELKPKTIRKVKQIVDGSVNGAAIEITWSDMDSCVIPSDFLRKSCPCASCIEQRNNKIYSASKTSLRIVEHDYATATNLLSIFAVGNYGINLQWEDGHDAGIYTYDYLRLLCISLNNEKICKNSGLTCDNGVCNCGK